MSDSIYSIHGRFSLGPNQILNWYLNGFPLESSNPHFTMKTDGLNIILYITEVSAAVFGRYMLKIEETDISNTMEFFLGEIKFLVSSIQLSISLLFFLNKKILQLVNE